MCRKALLFSLILILTTRGYSETQEENPWWKKSVFY